MVASISLVAIVASWDVRSFPVFEPFICYINIIAQELLLSHKLFSSKLESHFRHSDHIIMDRDTHDREHLSNVPDPNNPLYFPTSVWRFNEEDSMKSTTSTSPSTSERIATADTAHASHGPERRSVRECDGGQFSPGAQSPATATTPDHDYDADVEDEADDIVAAKSFVGENRVLEYDCGDDGEGGPTFFGWR